MSQDFNKILREAVRIAHGAGAILREGLQHVATLRVDFKQADTDPVTEYDRRSEDYIVESLKMHFPSHRIFGEEGGNYPIENPNAATENFEWQVDPLDGTVNFSHGFPIFAVSLGLLRDGVPCVGVVYNPVTDETFAAAQGHGATLNGKPIYVSKTPVLSRSLLNTGFPYDRRTTTENNFAQFVAFQRTAQEVRRVGSAALDCCTVACGRMDGYWEMKMSPYDIAAGILIIREAGGLVTDFDGGDAIFAKCRVVASNGLIHQEMLNVLKENRD